MKQLLFISVSIFIELSKKKKTLKNAHIIRQFKLQEIIGICSDCFNKKIKGYLINQEKLHEESSFQEARKLLIQYYPIVNYFLVDLTIDDK